MLEMGAPIGAYQWLLVQRDDGMIATWQRSHSVDDTGSTANSVCFTVCGPGPGSTVHGRLLPVWWSTFRGVDGAKFSHSPRAPSCWSCSINPCPPIGAVHTGPYTLAEAEIAAPAPHVRSQLFHYRLHAGALGHSRDLPDSLLEPPWMICQRSPLRRYFDVSPAARAGSLVGDNEPHSVTDASDYTIPVRGEQRGMPMIRWR